MHRIFLDTDIIIDLLAKREPFFDQSAKLFTIIEQEKILAFTTPVVISNLHYILSKYKNSIFAFEQIRKLRLLVKVLCVNEKIVDLALNSSMKDFEDAIQYYSALDSQINFIITRNIKDFTEKKVIAITPSEYLKLFNTYR